jgi:hypothetical protein
MDKLFELLKRASEKLQDYCTDMNGDLNDSLANEINTFIESGGWRTDFENIPNDEFMFDITEYVLYTIPVLVTVLSDSGNRYVVSAHSYQYTPDPDDYKIRWIESGRDSYEIKGKVIAYQLLPGPYNAE